MIKLSREEKSVRMPGHGLRKGAAEVWREQDWPVQKSLLSAARNIDYRYWTAGDLQNQEDTPHCVEYSARGMLEASPHRNQVEGIPRGSIYHWCQDHDEWAGNDYDGTSVHAAMKWLVANKYVTSYRWAKTVADVHAHLVTTGVVVAGTTWTKDMSYVDEFGFARFTGENYGGHAWIIRGSNRLALDPVTRKTGKMKLRNSWGVGYAEGGEAWLTFADMQKLIDDYGEVALPVEVMAKK